MDRYDASRVQLIDPIGGGGTSTVWRAWDPATRRFVAAKVSSVTEPAPREPAAGLVHPHLVTGSAGSGPWPTQPLVRGGTAERLLAEHGALPADYVAVLLDQLLLALAAVHAAGLVHRDVKPANLLLEPTGTGRPHLRLADFGVAVPVGAGVPPAGTDGYLAPEAASGAPADPRHDLYAAGITAVELLTGRVPRDDRDVPRGPLRALLRGLTDPDPPSRPATAELARARLHALGVPKGTPWRARPHPPDVPDRMRRLSILQRWAVQGVSAAQ
jgi:eukaryotic-like serine/threonine-protein kinase